MPAPTPETKTEPPTWWGRPLAETRWTLELARLLGDRAGLELAPRVMRRVRRTPAQSGLDASERRRNLRRAFEASASVKGRNVVLVDDVVTTTATARECARALKRAGAARVELWAVARAGE